MEHLMFLLKCHNGISLNIIVLQSRTLSSSETLREFILSFTKVWFPTTTISTCRQISGWKLHHTCEYASWAWAISLGWSRLQFLILFSQNQAHVRVEQAAVLHVLKWTKFSRTLRFNHDECRVQAIDWLRQRNFSGNGMSPKGTINYKSFSPLAIDVDDTFHR